MAIAMGVSRASMLLAAAALLAAHAQQPPSTVFTHGEQGFPCIRIPSTLALPFDVVLSFAAARSYTGDSCFPSARLPSAKAYSAHVVKRSTDRGMSWGPMQEIGRTPVGAKIPGSYASRGEWGYYTSSPEGCSVYSQKHGAVLTIWLSDNVSDATTGLRLWQSETDISGLEWSAPHPLNISGLLKANVSAGTHISPGNGIEVQYGAHAGRLLHVLILESSNVLDVVIYSDDGGTTWQLSETPLPHNGEAQLAEIRTASGGSAIVFDGRSRAPVNGNKKAYPRGIAWSYDGGATFTDIRFADDLSAGTSCLASIVSLDQHPVAAAAAPAAAAGVRGEEGATDEKKNHSSSLLFSHPSQGNRSFGVLLRSDDAAESWQLVGSATPEEPGAMFAYSNLNSVPAEDSDRPQVGLTYETGDPGCAAHAAACKIVYRIFQL